MSLLVIGSVAFDAIETPFGKTDKIIGGAASYISLASSYFADKVNLCAVVGEDFPAKDIQILKDHGVDTEGLQVKKGEKTFFWSGKYHNDMNSRDTLITELNVLGDFDPIIPSSYQDCDYLMLGNLSPQVQKLVVERLERRPKLIALDTMNFWMDIAWDEVIEAVQMVDVLIINDGEARQLSKEYSLVKAARTIMELGPTTVVIKKGEHGALLFHGKQIYFCPALPLENVFDPTGAGDTFAGGFVGYLAANEGSSFVDFKRAVIYGSAMASFCVEKFGTEQLIGLSKETIENRVQEFIDLSQIEMRVDE